MDQSKLEQYIGAHTSEASALLQSVERETHLKTLMPRMLSGQVQGRFLSMVAHMIRPAKVLEIGTFTGYGTLCLAEGLAPQGIIHTIEVNPEMENANRRIFDKAGIARSVIMHTGNALHIIPNLEDRFDLVFLDADKINYPKYYPEIMAKLKFGGFLLVDNVLWSGKVTADACLHDKDTRAIAEFNDMVQKDVHVENVLIPLRDGLMLIRKIG
jgi:predicted O-methyltransferase YrrM